MTTRATIHLVHPVNPVSSHAVPVFRLHGYGLGGLAVAGHPGRGGAGVEARAGLGLLCLLAP